MFMLMLINFGYYFVKENFCYYCLFKKMAVYLICVATVVYSYIGCIAL